MFDFFKVLFIFLSSSRVIFFRNSTFSLVVLDESFLYFSNNASVSLFSSSKNLISDLYYSNFIACSL